MTRQLSGSNTLVIASIIGLAVGLPQIFLTTFSVFLKPLIGEFGWSRSQVSLLFSAVTLSIAFASPVVTWLIEKFGLRRILVGSIIGLAVTLSAMSTSVESYALFFVWVILIGVIGTGTTTFTYLGVFPSWFDKRLGIALGIAATGIGLGQMVFPVLAQHFITNFGWRAAYQLLALISVVVALPGALFIIRNKADGGPGQPVANTNKTNEQGKADARAARSTPEFWLLAAGFFIIPMIAAGCTLHAMPIFLEKGFAEDRAAGIFALGGFSLMIARVVAGFLLDWIGPRAVATIACVAAIIAPLLLGSWGPMAIIALAPLLYGLALGIEGDLMPYGLRNAFGAPSVPILYGLFFGIFNLGVVTGPLLMGVTYDQTGSYDLALIALSVSAVLALPIFWLGLKTSHIKETQPT